MSTKPFDMPSRATLQASSKKVFAHIMGAQNLKRAHNKISSQDAWAGYLAPDGAYSTWGGYVRNRPLPRVPDVVPPSTFLIDDLLWEIQQAQDAGIDGFMIDLLSWSGGAGTSWEYTKKICLAAKQFGNGFKIVLQMDATGSTGSTVDEATVVAGLAELITDAGSAIYRLSDNRIVISAYTAENRTDTFWTNVLSQLASATGQQIAFFPCVQTFNSSTLARFDGYSMGIGPWGSRSPGANDPSATIAGSPKDRINTAHNTIGVDGVGMKYMQPIGPQDYRTWQVSGNPPVPANNTYQEAANSLNLRNSWQVAIEGGADWVQLVTWNDFREHSAIAPSTHYGWNFLDLMAYYIAWWKTGAAPTITKDCVYLSHRKHKYDAQWTYSGQTKYSTFYNTGTSQRDMVEALAFLTAPSTVEITAGATNTRSFTSGIYSFTVPLSNGQISSRILRAGQPVATVTSPFAVVSQPYVQDLQYIMVSSLNEGQTIGDPDPPAPPSGPYSRWVGDPLTNRWVG